jgi:hypothetical protein
MNHTFLAFQQLIDRANMIERKSKEMEDRKHKISGPSLGATVAPVFLATHLNSSGMATRRDISSKINVRIRSRPRDNTSSRNSTARTIN